MKAIIEIELGNEAFGNNDAERLFEMRQVMEKLMDMPRRLWRRALATWLQRKTITATQLHEWTLLKAM